MITYIINTHITNARVTYFCVLHNINIHGNDPDLIGRVRNGETPPFRPVIPVGCGMTDPRDPLVLLMKDCWSEDINSRPDFIVIKSRLNAINKGK